MASAPVRPLRTAEEQRNSSDEARRVVQLLVVVGAPLAWLTLLVVRTLLVRLRRVPLWAVGVGLSVMAVVVALIGGVRSYLRSWQDLAVVVVEVFRREVTTPVAMERTLLAVVHQIPVQLVVGAIIGTLWAVSRRRQSANWREEAPERSLASDQSVSRALAKLPEWPDAPTAVNEAGDREVRTLRVRIGVERTGQCRPVDIRVGELGEHAYVDGPAGSGKTTTLLEVVSGLVEQPAAQAFQIPVVIINMKPDPEVTDAIRAIALSAGRRFRRVTQNGVHGEKFSPLAGLDADEVASAVFQVEENAQGGGFSEPHHRRAATRFLNLAARALFQLARRRPETWSVSYRDLARLMSIPNLNQVAGDMDREWQEDWTLYQAQATKQLSESIAGMAQRLGVIAEGGARRVLVGQGHEGLSLEDAIRAGDVVLFDLDAARDAESSRAIGNLAVENMASCMARLESQQWKYRRASDGAIVISHTGERVPVRHCQFIVDEFSALGGVGLGKLFDRVRSAGAGVLLATQVTQGLETSGPDFRARVLTNTSLLFLHQQKVEASTFAEFMGTETAYIETKQVYEEGGLLAPRVYHSGQGNIREGREFRVHPDELRALRRGEIVVLRTADNSVTRAKVRYRARRQMPPLESIGESGQQLPPSLGEALPTQSVSEQPEDSDFESRKAVGMPDESWESDEDERPW